MKKLLIGALVLSMGLVCPLSVHAGWSPGKDGGEDNDIEKTVAMFKEKAPNLNSYFDDAAGWAVFPTVGKGGIGIGGAYGKGVLLEKGKRVGSTSLTQLSYGFQLGGQAYSEIVFFKDETALEDFKRGNFEFGAGVSAVAATAGISMDTDYNGGVAVFTLAKGGLMYEATVSGQKFKYTPDN